MDDPEQARLTEKCAADQQNEVSYLDVVLSYLFYYCAALQAKARSIGQL